MTPARQKFDRPPVLVLESLQWCSAGTLLHSCRSCATCYVIILLFSCNATVVCCCIAVACNMVFRISSMVLFKLLIPIVMKQLLLWLSVVATLLRLCIFFNKNAKDQELQTKCRTVCLFKIKKKHKKVSKCIMCRIILNNYCNIS